LNDLKDFDAQRENLLMDLKLKWTDMAKSWAEQLQKSQAEVEKLKSENQSAKEVRIFRKFWC
jgi:hypothetical protein